MAVIRIGSAKMHLGKIAKGEGKAWKLGEEGIFLYLKEDDKKGVAEVHETTEDIFVVLEGNPVFITSGPSGQLVNPWQESEGEWRAQEIKGGVRTNLCPNDVFVVPAGIPHQRLPNGKILLLVFKIKDRGKK